MPMVENFDAFFDEDEFAETAFWNDGVSDHEVKGIFDEAYHEMDQDGVVISGYEPKFTCPTSEVSGMKRGHTFEVDERTFRVANIEKTGTGISTIFLHKGVS